MDAAFLLARKTATLAQITVYEAAVSALEGGVEEYTLDTGQTRLTVRRADVARLNAVLDSLYNRYEIICKRIAGPQGTIGAPDW